MCSAPPTGTFQCIKDRGQNFQANNATVVTTDSSTIDGRSGTLPAGYLLNQNSQEACFLFNAAIGGNGNWSLSHAYVGDNSVPAQLGNLSTLSTARMTQPIYGAWPSASATAMAQMENERGMSLLSATHNYQVAPQYVAPNRTVSGTTDNPTAVDCGATIQYSSSSAVTVTLPTSGMPGNPGWCYIALLQTGTAKVTPQISAAAPHNAHSWTGTNGQYSVISVGTPDGGTTWYMAGDGS